MQDFRTRNKTPNIAVGWCTVTTRLCDSHDRFRPSRHVLCASSGSRMRDHDGKLLHLPTTHLSATLFGNHRSTSSVECPNLWPRELMLWDDRTDIMANSFVLSHEREAHAPRVPSCYVTWWRGVTPLRNFQCPKPVDSQHDYSHSPRQNHSHRFKFVHFALNILQRRCSFVGWWPKKNWWGSYDLITRHSDQSCLTPSGHTAWLLSVFTKLPCPPYISWVQGRRFSLRRPTTGLSCRTEEPERLGARSSARGIELGASTAAAEQAEGEPLPFSLTTLGPRMQLACPATFHFGTNTACRSLWPGLVFASPSKIEIPGAYRNRLGSSLPASIQRVPTNDQFGIQTLCAGN
jgi:hypothetical protein